MTELLRPSLYDAWHEVREVAPGTDAAIYDVVGPVCESADVLARARRLAVQAGDLLAIMDCGAYAASMGSNYNSRPRPAEVLVDGTHTALVRRRETLADLMSLDELPA
jgi:diaminopimelate decarboxylase